MEEERKCGCKGIRTCLLCEKGSSFASKSKLLHETKPTYTYCPHCNLCWPDSREGYSPSFLDGVTIFRDFISGDEEAGIVSNIDKIAWMLSQSGRRKQDFGPKVNFKKKKVRIGEFRGFPKFTSPILQRLQNLPELSDFEPVELCHLEYSPERGSSIDAHVDDFWLWGERLVTINLESATVLTLVPCTEDSCDCSKKSESNFNLLTSAHSCCHKFRHVPATETTGKADPSCDVTGDKSEANQFNTYSSQCYEDNKYQNCHAKCNQQDCPITGDSVSLVSNLQSDSATSHVICLNKANKTNMRTMCSLYRSRYSVSGVAVRIVLPPRSLIVLAGCARYNWTHEIKRQDIVSRRLAMTFRELTPEFLHGGKESVIGKELLNIANNFCDL